MMLKMASTITAKSDSIIRADKPMSLASKHASRIASASPTNGEEHCTRLILPSI